MCGTPRCYICGGNINYICGKIWLQIWYCNTYVVKMTAYVEIIYLWHFLNVVATDVYNCNKDCNCYCFNFLHIIWLIQLIIPCDHSIHISQ